MQVSIIAPLEQEDVESRRKKLEEALEELSQKVDDGDLDRIAHDLESVYADGYRQMYSELYPRMSTIQNGPEGDLEVLIINLEAIRTMVRDDYLKDEGPRKYKDYLYGSILKLTDHINLEWQRMEQNADLDRRIRDSMAHVQELESKASKIADNASNVEEIASEALEKSQKLERRTSKAMKKARNLQLEMVAILAIFAAIVVAFAGGLNLLSGSLSGVGQSDLLNLLSVLSLCGIVLFNTIAFLMHAVVWIVRRQNDTVHMSGERFGKKGAEEGVFVDPLYIIIANIILVSIFGVTTYYALI